MVRTVIPYDDTKPRLCQKKEAAKNSATPLGREKYIKRSVKGLISIHVGIFRSTTNYIT